MILVSLPIARSILKINHSESSSFTCLILQLQDSQDYALPIKRQRTLPDVVFLRHLYLNCSAFLAFLTRIYFLKMYLL